MNRGPRRLVGLSVAAAALAGGGLLARSGREERARRLGVEADRVADDARRDAGSALDAALVAVRERTAAAARVEPFLAALKNGVDDRTLRDLLGSEDWWQPFRSELPLAVIARGRETISVAAPGVPAGAAGAASLLGDARAHGTASGFFADGGAALAAAAIHVKAPGDKEAELLLARPVRPETLEPVALRAHGAVLLSDGKKVLAAAGPARLRGALGAGVGHEASGRSVVSGLTAPALAAPVGAGLWLWSQSEVVPAPPPGGMPPEAPWAAAGVLAALALFVGFRAGAAPGRVDGGAGAELSEVKAKLAETQAALARVTQTADPGRAASGPAGAVSGSGPAMPVGATKMGLAPTMMPTSAGLPGGGAAAVAATAAAVPASTNMLGRYSLLNKLGEGGMAEVYTAAAHGAEGFRRIFVLKRLRAELARDKTLVQQFIDEARLGASLVHSNIVPVFDFGKAGEEYFMALEYIAGRDLTTVVKRAIERDGRALSVAAAAYVAQETLEALSYAHAKTDEEGNPMGLVHRDVSPNNILVSTRGEVKLIDFGIMKAEGRGTKTQVGIVKGNVSFMAPEQARGHAVDGRSDLYSLGLVLFYALTGQTLFGGDATYDTLVRAATGPGPEEQRRIAALPAPMAEIVGRVLAMDPGQRYDNAAAFLAAVSPLAAQGAAEIAKTVQQLFAGELKRDVGVSGSPAAT